MTIKHQFLCFSTAIKKKDFVAFPIAPEDGLHVEMFEVIRLPLSRLILIADEASSTRRVNGFINEHVSRLIYLRHSDWGWYNTPRVVIALQLSKPESFFGRNRSVEAMKQEFSSEGDR